MQKEKEGQLVTRTNDPKYLRYVREFYGKIAEQARGLLLSDDGPVAMIQIEMSMVMWVEEPEKKGKHTCAC